MALEKEQIVQKRVMDVVRKYGGYIYKNPQNIYTEKGRPDLTACIPVKINKLIELFGKDATIGLYVGIEMKRLGHLDEVSPAQIIVGKQIKDHGGLWFAVDNADLVEALMLKLGRDTDAVQ